MAGELRKIVTDAMDRILGVDLPDDVPLTRLQFVVRICRRLYGAGASKAYARERGYPLLLDFLKDEGISFGDSDYAWDGTAAITLTDEYEIAYWDAAA